MVASGDGAVSDVSVVTGAAGFVGQALVRALLAEGGAVRALILPGDRAAAELQALDPSAARLAIVAADVANARDVDDLIAGATRVFHTAALVHAWAPLGRFRHVNVTGTQNVARAALQHRIARLVHVSTTDVFGIANGETFDESSPFREWGEPYADTKIEAEKWLWEFHREKGLPLTVIYPGWVYGPGDKAFFPSLARAIADGMMMFWAHDVRLAWAYIDNLAEACVRASTHNAAVGNGYIVHDGMHGPTMENVCARIATIIGARPPTRHVPYGLAITAARILQGAWRALGVRTPPPLLSVDVKAFGFQYQLSNEKVRRELGWSPRVDIDEGMRRALAHLAERWPMDAKGRVH